MILCAQTRSIVNLICNCTHPNTSVPNLLTLPIYGIFQELETRSIGLMLLTYKFQYKFSISSRQLNHFLYLLLRKFTRLTYDRGILVSGDIHKLPRRKVHHGQKSN